ncbi:MAG: hypothetical protein AABY22_10380 [Nanoarchaeota archaeon]
MENKKITKEILFQILTKNEILCKIIKKLKILVNEGYTNDQIDEAIRNLKLPFSNHLFIITNFNELIKFDFKEN